MSRTIREAVFDAGCVGCTDTVRVAVAAGETEAYRAADAVKKAYRWQAREHGEGLILACPDCVRTNPKIGYCHVVGHDWQPISPDGQTSLLGCTRCRTKPPHRPLDDPDAVTMSRELPDADWDAAWFPAAGGSVDHLDLVEYRLRSLDDGALTEVGGAR